MTAARFGSLRPRVPDRLHGALVGRLPLAVVLTAAAVLFLAGHARHGASPTSGSLGDGWWTWADQGHYLLAAQAFARLDLSADRQWYEPAYAVLAAPFARSMPADPFLLPDLACYLASAWLFAALGARLLHVGPWGRPLAAAVFVSATNWSPTALAIWVVPWTTTPTVPLVFGSLLAALSFAERPRPAACFVAALCACSVAAFRPVDGVVVTGTTGLLMLRTLVRHRLDTRPLAAAIGAGLAGGLLPLLTAAALHAAVWGWHLGPYLELSGEVGFAWQLVPMRWVLLFVGPRPLLAEGFGLAWVFPWVIPGAAGMAACLAAPGRLGRAAHSLVIGTAAAQCLLLLAYRDLHPTGLWRYSNYHYFKWLIPAFALYALLLLQALASRRRRMRAVAPGAVVAVGLFCWRPGLQPAAPVLQAQVTGPHELVLRRGTEDLVDALLVAASGRREDVVMSDYKAAGVERPYRSNVDFKAYARPGGFLLVPLRALPAGLAITFPATVTLDAGVTPIGVRQHATFRLPCWLGPCAAPNLLPGRALTVDQPVAMDDSAEGYLAGDWSDAEPGGRWTQGGDVAFLAKVAGTQPGQALVLRVRGHGYVPGRGGDPVRVAVLANGRQVAEWQLTPGPDRDVYARIQSTDIGADGTLALAFHVANPRSPASHDEGTDRRRLGLFARSLTLEAEVPD